MGKKFIIELEEEVNGLCKAKGFNTLVFDKNGINKLTPYEEKTSGRWKPDEAWKLAGEIIALPTEARGRLFGHGDIKFILRVFSAVEAKEILDGYRAKKSFFDAAISMLDGYELTDEEIDEFIKCLKKRRE